MQRGSESALFDSDWVLLIQFLGQSRAGTCLEVTESKVSQEGMF